MTFTRARVAAVGGAAVLAAVLQSAPAPAQVPTPAASAVLERPNVVLVLTDDQTAESVAKMPYVSSRKDWISFDSAYAENALCCPTRATVLQGRYDTRTGVLTNKEAKLFEEAETLPVWLQRAGYRTGLFGKYFNNYPFGRGQYVPPGWDDWNAAYGPHLYGQYEYGVNSNGTIRRYGSAPADHLLTVLTDEVEQFVHESAGKPFFAYVTPTVNHSPWTATPARMGMFATAPVQQAPSYDEADVRDKPAWVRALPRPQRSAMEKQRRRAWAAAVSLDDSMREIDSALAAAGVLNDTVVILVSDNGLSFGEHRWVTKRCEYDECGRVPLMVRYPGQAARRVAAPVSLADLTSTVTGLAGARPGLPQDGRSFLPQLLDPAAPPARDGVLLHWPGGDSYGLRDQPGSLPQFWGLVTAGWKYVELDTGERELYDRLNDPYELTNRAGQRQLAKLQSELAGQLTAHKREAGVRAGEPLRTDLPNGEPMPALDLD